MVATEQRSASERGLTGLHLELLHFVCAYIKYVYAGFTAMDWENPPTRCEELWPLGRDDQSSNFIQGSPVSSQSRRQQASHQTTRPFDIIVIKVILSRHGTAISVEQLGASIGYVRQRKTQAIQYGAEKCALIICYIRSVCPICSRFVAVVERWNAKHQKLLEEFHP